MSQLEDEIGDIVAKSRRGLGISLHEAAARTGLTEDDYALIEACKLIPDPSALTAIAHLLSLDATKLAGIVDGWTPSINAPLQSEKAAVEMIPTTFGSKGYPRTGDYIENCYLLRCIATGSAAVIDPGGNLEGISDAVKRTNSRVERILITHSHHDHIGEIRNLTNLWREIAVTAHEEELSGIRRVDGNRVELVSDEETLRLGELCIKTLHTPGHTAGSVCYVAGGFCFVGDTLFAGSIGNPMSTRGYTAMLEAIQRRILTLTDETIILPGHGPITTVKEEKLHNPFF